MFSESTHITLINFLPERIILNRIGKVKDPQIEQEKKELTVRGFSCGLFGGVVWGVSGWGVCHKSKQKNC